MQIFRGREAMRHGRAEFAHSSALTTLGVSVTSLRLQVLAEMPPF